MRIARPPRIEIPHGVYHVVARGNERKTIYRDAADRTRFLEILNLSAARCGWLVLAYCLMSNHYHLLVETPNANLARGMRHLNGVYAQAFNRRYGRDGHLFQGRYGAVLVQRDEHLFGAVRYILRNPVRAGLCERVVEWPWSSHAASAGVEPPGFLATDALLAYFGERRAPARMRYLQLVNDDDPSPVPTHPLVHGDEDFVTTAVARIELDPEYPRAYVRPPRPPLAQVVQDEHDEAAIVRAHREYAYSMRQIADHLGCGLTTIHRRIRSWEQRRSAAASPLTATGRPTNGARSHEPVPGRDTNHATPALDLVV